jgi:hypothetical protein
MRALLRELADVAGDALRFQQEFVGTKDLHEKEEAALPRMVARLAPFIL